MATNYRIFEIVKPYVGWQNRAQIFATYADKVLPESVLKDDKLISLAYHATTPSTWLSEKRLSEGKFIESVSNLSFEALKGTEEWALGLLSRAILLPFIAQSGDRKIKYNTAPLPISSSNARNILEFNHNLEIDGLGRSKVLKTKSNGELVVDKNVKSMFFTDNQVEDAAKRVFERDVNEVLVGLNATAVLAWAD